MNIFLLGLFVSALGVGITFTVLGILVFLIWLLKVLFPDEGLEGEFETVKPIPDPEEERRVAVIAAAWYWQKQVERAGRSPSLGGILARPRSMWWRAGRTNREEQAG